MKMTDLILDIKRGLRKDENSNSHLSPLLVLLTVNFSLAFNIKASYPFILSLSVGRDTWLDHESLQLPNTDIMC